MNSKFNPFSELPEPLTNEQMIALHAIAQRFMAGRQLIQEIRTVNERANLSANVDEIMHILRDIANLCAREL